MQNNDHILGGVALTDFLQEYWQQKPLLIRNAIDSFSCPISANEMAGLACEPGVESRIILERDGKHPWQCLHGPFEEAFFTQLPDSHWTLLLQSCNLHIPAFAQLLEQFRFIPNWRVDDVMVSYAAPGGSVGPHTDNYDVFLLQAEGKRKWKISTQPVDDTDFVPNLDLKILKSFSAEQSWELEAGDMLYLPPGVAHHGVAEENNKDDDCITISIGFRAPNLKELSTALLDEVLLDPTEIINSKFYQDPHLPLQDNPGEISPQALEQINSMLQQELNHRIQDSDWFGKYITSSTAMSGTQEALLVDVVPFNITNQQCFQRIADGQQLVRNEASKLAFFLADGNEKDEKQTIHFFSNGQVEYYSLDLLTIVSLVCNHRYPPLGQLTDALNNKEALLFLTNVINQGYLYFERDVEDNGD